MRVHNETDHGVHVPGFGVVPPGEDATVRASAAVKQMIKGGTLREVRGGGSSNNEQEDG